MTSEEAWRLLVDGSWRTAGDSDRRAADGARGRGGEVPLAASVRWWAECDDPAESRVAWERFARFALTGEDLVAWPYDGTSVPWGDWVPHRLVADPAARLAVEQPGWLLDAALTCSAWRAAVIAAASPTLSWDAAWCVRAAVPDGWKVMVEAAVAGRDDTPPGMPDGWAASRSHVVRAAVARRASGVAAATFAELAADPAPCVRLAVAGNAAAPADVLAVLASDEHPAVVSAVVGNSGAAASDRSAAALSLR